MIGGGFGEGRGPPPARTSRVSARAAPRSGDGFAKFTNEVQHLVKVLSWEEVTDISVLKRGVRLPDYMPRDYRSAQIAASLDRSPSTVARELKRNGSRTQGYQPRYADQQAHARPLARV